MAASEFLGGALDLFGKTSLPEGWNFDLLGNRCTIRRGASPRPAGDPKYFGDGSIPWIKIGDATKTGGRYIESTDAYVNQEGAKHSVRIPPDSLIIANSGVSLGFAAITRIGGCIHDGWLYPTDFKNLDRNYLYYCINLVTHKLRRFADGTTQPNLNTDIARRLLLPMPPLDQQRAIAHILGALDDKIELNRRMNDTHEAIARAVFKSWFVDFDPVHAKAEGRDPGLPKHIADLFPDSFEESELGDIPREWEVKALGDLLELAYGKALKAEDRQNGDIPVYGSNGAVGWHNERLVAGPGIVVGRKGNPGIVTWVENDFFPIDTTFFVVPKTSCQSLAFLFRVLRAHNLALLGADSAVPGLNRNLAYMSRQVLPPAPLLAQFDRLATAISQRVHHANDESRWLATLRDTLLPKLISGDLQLRDPARFSLRQG